MNARRTTNHPVARTCLCTETPVFGWISSTDPISLSEVICFVRSSNSFTRRSNNSAWCRCAWFAFYYWSESDIQINVEYVHSDVK